MAAMVLTAAWSLVMALGAVRVAPGHSIVFFFGCPCLLTLSQDLSALVPPSAPDAEIGSDLDSIAISIACTIVWERELLVLRNDYTAICTVISKPTSN